MRTRLPTPAPAWLIALVCLTTGLFAAAPPSGTARPVDFARDIRPILASRCVSCHGPDKQKGDLRLDERDSSVRGGSIVPGNSGASSLIGHVDGNGPGRPMPPTGPRLTAGQVALLRAWIDQGATWPAAPPKVAVAPTHWAYRPLLRPAVPAPHDRAPIGNPIDAFIQTALETAALSPAPPAERRRLIRRLAFDLMGLPPTAEEVDAFITDRRPDAYERLVDRLLGSPAYGERWARHWLDVVHYAETHGHDQDVPRENAWPYRDYLIRALNDDRPYGRFVEEQVAGDVLYPDTPDGVAATGMLAAGPWDESSQQSIRDDTLDKKQAQNLDRDDIVTTVFSAFSSTTVHCARCHDHKFDPVTQEHYYGLQAVFAGIDRANRPHDHDPAVHRRRHDLLVRQKQIRNLTYTALLDPTHTRATDEWEREHRARAWQPLALQEIGTAHGSVPARLPDGSVRFGGSRPEREVYTLTASAPPGRLTAVRLEVLTDDTLPHRGPGRQDNGNLHLNEFRVEVDTGGKTPGWKPAPIAAARADFDQEGWTAALAIDGKPATAWGIYPAVGKSHEIVFLFATPIEPSTNGRLRFSLEQTHGAGHLIGRLRLSATAATAPSRAVPLPADLTTVLNTPAGKRTAAQRAALTRHVLTENVTAGLDRLGPQRMVYAAASDFQPTGSFRPAKGCRPIFILRRGDVTKPAAAAVPQALGLLPGLPGTLVLADPADEGGRRAALARWLSDPRNVLTWRSMANRVWHYHFGRGLVATPGDLGRMGGPPSHPELLDWLACELRDNGGSLKRLHRLIVTSAAYRRAVAHDPAAARVDGDNVLLWRMNRTRLDAESLRDAVLAVSGRLDRTMGGPSVRHFLSTAGIHVTPNADYLGFDVDAPAALRRGVYRFVFRTLPDPFLAALDCPDASQFTPARSASVTPLQALALLNDRFMVRQTEHLAARIAAEVGADPAQQLDRLFALTLGRPATARERTLLGEHLRRHGLSNVCRLVLNSNEFVFVD